MCIYHEGLRTQGAGPVEVLSLTLLPSFEKGSKFLHWFRENPGVGGDLWQVEALEQLSIAACDEALLTRVTPRARDEQVALLEQKPAEPESNEMKEHVLKSMFGEQHPDLIGGGKW